MPAKTTKQAKEAQQPEQVVVDPADALMISIDLLSPVIDTIKHHKKNNIVFVHVNVTTLDGISDTKLGKVLGMSCYFIGQKIIEITTTEHKTVNDAIIDLFPFMHVYFINSPQHTKVTKAHLSNMRTNKTIYTHYMTEEQLDAMTDEDLGLLYLFFNEYISYMTLCAYKTVDTHTTLQDSTNENQEKVDVQKFKTITLMTVCDLLGNILNDNNYLSSPDSIISKLKTYTYKWIQTLRQVVNFKTTNNLPLLPAEEEYVANEEKKKAAKLTKANAKAGGAATQLKAAAAGKPKVQTGNKVLSKKAPVVPTTEADDEPEEEPVEEPVTLPKKSTKAPAKKAAPKVSSLSSRTRTTASAALSKKHNIVDSTQEGMIDSDEGTAVPAPVVQSRKRNNVSRTLTFHEASDDVINSESDCDDTSPYQDMPIV